MALAEAKTTVRAASRLHVTQSAVSRALLSIEDRLGVRLFERGRQGLSPTSAGQKLLDGAGPLLAQLVALEQAARAPEAPPERVRVVCECYTAYRWLPSALRGLTADDSRLQVEIAFEHTGSPVEALLASEIDVALLTTARIRALHRHWRMAYRPEVAAAAGKLSALLRTRAPQLKQARQHNATARR